MEAFKLAESRKKPSPDLLFTDVYDQLPLHLKKQQQEMSAHVKAYQEHYPLDKHESFWLQIMQHYTFVCFSNLPQA